MKINCAAIFRHKGLAPPEIAQDWNDFRPRLARDDDQRDLPATQEIQSRASCLPPIRGVIKQRTVEAGFKQAKLVLDALDMAAAGEVTAA